MHQPQWLVGHRRQKPSDSRRVGQHIKSPFGGASPIDHDIVGPPSIHLSALGQAQKVGVIHVDVFVDKGQKTTQNNAIRQPSSQNLVHVLEANSLSD
jgi:hypothetical protein